ncbi:DNRLRE domain-containing protein, partial [Enterococcus casseliflavus]|uniref:DNRLRE domain-containing protein n=1 Tax=Enterococcus casseliflavus TaxID=37734 RepID=UPI003D100FC0
TGSWDEDTSTGNSVPTIAGNAGMIPDGGSGTTYVADITSVVQAWSSGSAANWGLEILHVINGVGIAQNSFYSDDAATLANRPLLSVTF